MCYNISRMIRGVFMLLKILFVLCIVLQVIFVPLFLQAQWPGICRKSLFYKMICATSFVCIGVLCMAIAGNKSVYAIMMLVGLIFGWLGDFFLHLNNTQKAFATGFCNFLVGHIVYIAAYIRTIPVVSEEYSFFNIYEIILALALIGLAIIGMVKFRIEISISVLKYGIVIYTLLLIVMNLKASALGLCYWLNGGKYGVVAFLVLAIGSLCFMLSDATLGIIMFGGQKRNKPLKVFNIVTYFLAQTLLASSILFIKA